MPFTLKQRPSNPFKKDQLCQKSLRSALAKCKWIWTPRVLTIMLFLFLMLIADHVLRPASSFLHETDIKTAATTQRGSSQVQRDGGSNIVDDTTFESCASLFSNYKPNTEPGRTATQRPNVRPRVIAPTLECPRPPSAVLCTIMKDELRYVNEWLDYNTALGFSHFYLYDNHDNATLADYLDETRPGWKEYISVDHWPGGSQQTKALTHCGTIQARRDNQTYVAMFDGDEYLVLKRHEHVVEMLLEHLQSGSVSVNWYNFGPDPVGNFTTDILDAEETFRASANLASNGLPRPLIQRNQHRGPLGWHGTNRSFDSIDVKTIVLQKDLDSVQNPHAAELIKGKTRKNLLGEEFSGYVVNSGEDTAVLYHYGFKSVPEFIFKKCVRGRPTVPRETWIKECEPFRGFAVNPASWRSYWQVHDDSAWSFLKDRIPWYRQFDEEG